MFDNNTYYSMAKKSEKCGWENDIQWEGRRQFIETHMGTLPIEQLEALSVVWANMKFLGCRYPQATEARVHELEDRCPVDIQKDVKRKQEEAKKKAIIKDFILYVRDSSGEEQNPIGLLYGNAQRAKKAIEFQELGLNEKHSFSCAVVIDDILVATGEGMTKKDAKRNCAERAVQILRKSQPVVDELKSHEKAHVIERNQLADGKNIEPPKIPESNLGSRMLRKMGWTGGGVGREGNKGRADPIMVCGVQERRGLGQNSCETEVNKMSVKNTIQNFMMDSSKKELRFSSTLSKEDRAIVHKVCQQYGLRHKSFGGGQDRYLVISKQ